MKIVEYIDAFGRSPFATWFDGLEPLIAAKVTIALTRLAHGNVSNVKGVGSGVLEYRIDFGPGYRLYFGRDGEEMVLMLCGGTKKRQQSDIAKAIAFWSDYKARKKDMKTWH